MILSKVLLSTGSNEDDEIALDTCCGWAFILSNKNKDMLEEVRTEDHVVQTLAGKTKYKTEVGKIGGEKVIVVVVVVVIVVVVVVIVVIVVVVVVVIVVVVVVIIIVIVVVVVVVVIVIEVVMISIHP